MSGGLLVSIDGPGGVGKSTLAAAVAKQLTDAGTGVHQTREPSPTWLGEMIRAGTGTYRGMALACLVAGTVTTTCPARSARTLRGAWSCSVTVTCLPATSCSGWTD
jgi:hypothetical protein